MGGPGDGPEDAGARGRAHRRRRRCHPRAGAVRSAPRFGRVRAGLIEGLGGRRSVSAAGPSRTRSIASAPACRVALRVVNCDSRPESLQFTRRADRDHSGRHNVKEQRGGSEFLTLCRPGRPNVKELRGGSGFLTLCRPGRPNVKELRGGSGFLTLCRPGRPNVKELRGGSGFLTLCRPGRPNVKELRGGSEFLTLCRPGRPNVNPLRSRCRYLTFDRSIGRRPVWVGP
jgi:hypothetical protein